MRKGENLLKILTKVVFSEILKVRRDSSLASLAFLAQNDKRGDSPCGIDKIAYQVFLESIIRNLQGVRVVNLYSNTQHQK